MKTLHPRALAASRPLSRASANSGVKRLSYAVAALVVLTSVASAQTSTWLNQTTGNWSASGSWASGGVPSTTNPNTSLFFTGASTVYTATNDLTSLELNELQVTGAGTGSLTLAGNGINFVTNGSNVLPTLSFDRTGSGNGFTTVTMAITATNALAITNSGSGAVSLNGGLTANAATTFTNSGSGAVGISGMTANSAVTITDQTGGGAITVTGALTDNSNFTFNSGGSGVGFSNTISFSGGGSVTYTTGYINVGTSNNFNYSGATTISSGAIVDFHRPTQLGLSDIAAANLVLDGGTAELDNGNFYNPGIYRNFTVTANGGEIDAAGGSSEVAVTGNMTATGTSGSQTFTLGGAGTGLSGAAGIETGSINNGSGSNVTNLTKSGAGTWIVTGANTYSGTTTISQGILVVSTIAPTGGVSNLGSTSGLVLGGASTQGVLKYAGNSASFANGVTLGAGGGEIDPLVAGQTLTIGGNVTGTGDLLTVGGAGNLTLNGNIATGTNGALTMNGTGVLTVTGANTYTGTTTLNEGTLNLGGGTSTGSMNAGSVLKLAGGALTYTRTGNTTQTFASTTLSPGASSVSAVSGDTLALGAITRGAGSTVDFSGAGTVTTTTANTGGTILGGWATVGGADWAVSAGNGVTAGNVTALSAYAADAWASGDNTTVSANANDNFVGTTNSLKFGQANGTVALTGASTITTGGILVTSAVGNNLSQIVDGGGSSLTAGAANASQDLIVIQNNTSNMLQIGAPIVNNGSGTTGLTKSGPGEVLTYGNNTYTGTTTVNAGTLDFAFQNSLYNGTTASWTPSKIIVAGGATLAVGIGGSSDFSGSLSTLLSNLATSTGTSGLESGSTLGLDTTNATGSFNYGSVIANPNSGVNVLNLSIFGGSGSGGGTVILSGANTFSGATTVATGNTLQLSNASALQNSTLVPGNGAVTFDNTVATTTLLTTAGYHAFQVGGLSGSGALALTDNKTPTADPVILEVGNNNFNNTFFAPDTYSGALSGTGGIYKDGANTLVLSGASTYTGQTMLTGGIVSVSALPGPGTTSSNIGNPAGNTGLTTAGIVFAGGDLSYTGNSATYNRGFYVTNGGSGELDVTTAGQTLTLSTNALAGSIANNLTIGGAGNLYAGVALSFGANSTFVGNLTKTGTGTLTLAVANTYDGNTNLLGGVVNLGVAQGTSSGPLGGGTGSLPEGGIYFFGGTLQYSSVNNTDYSSHFSAGNGQSFMIDTNSRLVTFATGLGGAGSTLTLDDTNATPGKLTLTGASTFTGLTTVTRGELDLNNTTGQALASNVTDNGGTVKLLANNQLATTATVTVSSGTFTFNGKNQTVLSVVNTGGTVDYGSGGVGTVTVTDPTWQSGGTNNVSGPTTFTNGLIVTGGTNTITSGTTGGQGILALGNGAPPALAFSGTLSPAVTINGDTSVSNLPGIVQLGGDVTADGASTATIATGTGAVSGELDLNGANRNFTVGGSTTPGLLISAQIVDRVGSGGALTKSGTGAMTISGSNTYGGGTTVSAGALLLANSIGSATGTGPLTVNAGATIGGTGSSSGTTFSIAGTSTSARANVLVGMNSPGDTTVNTTLGLVAVTGTISNANLTFNINDQVAGGLGADLANSGTELNVGTTAVTFLSGIKSTTLTLNVQNLGIIGAFTPYVLIAGNKAGMTGLGSTQYSGLTFGTSIGNIATGLITPISGSSIAGNGDLTLAMPGLAASYYGANSYLFLYQDSATGADDIEVEVVPEPETWAMMLGGFGVLLFWLRHKNRKKLGARFSSPGPMHVHDLGKVPYRVEAIHRQF